jgi:hypothetical protein
MLLTLGTSVQGFAQPQTFLPKVVSADSLEFNSAFAPDGNVFFFSRTINKQTRILFCKKTTDGWTAPEQAPFSSSEFSDADPAFSPDGALYFISNRRLHATDTTKDYDIWKVNPIPGNRWSEPINVKTLNSEKDEFYISFTRNGDIYFSSSREGGYGEEDIYYCRRTGGTFESPRNLGDKINTIHSEYDPFISPNEAALLFTSSGRKDSFGKGDLYWSVKSGHDWVEAVHFAANINTSSRDFCPYLTSDLKTFFFSSGGDIKFRPVNELPARLKSSIKP